MSVTIWSNEENALKARSKVGWEEVQCRNRVEDVREAVEWRKGDSQFPPKHDVQWPEQHLLVERNSLVRQDLVLFHPRRTLQRL